MLISSYFAERILLTAPLVKWYLDYGLEITQLYEFIEYAPEKTFEKFGLEVSKARRLGNCNTSKTILANIWDLIGNISYMASLLSKDKFHKISVHDQSIVDKTINPPGL